ncbi:chondroitin sulfate glucuronyltransferase [Xenopus laevis]|uniref:Hexosyltransferase n=2 Tax=Xenopus laevis TaxID=8355 RepID=A0A1L8FQ07_XENLA|nr:chondroitin sulfate glucuronyltransferase [Xenopus laevis]OCT73631.1 hypothetical protein XELAEV_18032593mg [Xenopus laevis]
MRSHTDRKWYRANDYNLDPAHLCDYAPPRRQRLCARMWPPFHSVTSASLLGLLRPALPLILGLSLGCSLSLLHVSLIQGDSGEQCLGKAGRFLEVQEKYPKKYTDNLKPKIIPYSRPPHVLPSKVLRTRYIQSELGFRERLSVIVLSSRSTMNTLAVGVNRTLSPHVSRLLFFTAARASKAPAGMEVITLGDERPAWLMYHTLRYMQTHLLSGYDWFFITQDDSYTNGYRLQDLVAHLSPAPPTYLGRPMEFIGGQDGWQYCHGGSGFLLSRSLLLSLVPHLDFCRSDILSPRSDEWLGRCLQDCLGLACMPKYQNLHFTSLDLARNTNVENLAEESVREAVSVYPVRDPVVMYQLQRRLSQIRLHRTYSRIQQLQAEIRNLSSWTQRDDVFWPVGINPPFSPTSRFDLLTWEYFTETHTYSCHDGAPKCLLQGVWLLDVRQILEEAVEQLNGQYNPFLRFHLQHLLNGYRRFDPTRGMEYTLDLLLQVTTERGHVGVLNKRLSLLRPLGRVEILPMPYVTEATRAHFILPLVPTDTAYVTGFLDAFATNMLDTQENVALTVVLVYDLGSAGHTTDAFEEVRAVFSELERRFSHLHIEQVKVRSESPSQVGIMEVVSKKHPRETLFFLVSAWSEVTTEAVNRCRMNAIKAWQVFSPVHYQEFSPDIVRHSFDPPSSPDPLKNGHFDHFSSSEFCFYNSDFMAARQKMLSERVEREEEEDEEGGYTELLELFLHFSELHVFRALEPALVQRFSLRPCSSHLSGDGYHRCVLSNLESLGSRSHLAMALFEQEQTNST